MDRSIDLYKMLKTHYKNKPYTIGVCKCKEADNWYEVVISYSPSEYTKEFIQDWIVEHWLSLKGIERKKWRDYICMRVDISVFEHFELMEVQNDRFKHFSNPV